MYVTGPGMIYTVDGFYSLKLVLYMEGEQSALTFVCTCRLGELGCVIRPQVLQAGGESTSGR